MVITCFYYLTYPDCDPPDPYYASSEVYVEVAMVAGTTDAFDYTFKLKVGTTKFTETSIASEGSFFSDCVLVVPVFEDSLIKAALERILPQLAKLNGVGE